MNRRQKISLFVLGCLRWGLDAGWFTGGVNWRFSPKGLALFDQLEASDFRPTELEVTQCIRALVITKYVLCNQQEISTLIRIISNWDESKQLLTKE